MYMLGMMVVVSNAAGRQDARSDLRIQLPGDHGHHGSYPSGSRDSFRTPTEYDGDDRKTPLEEAEMPSPSASRLGDGSPHTFGRLRENMGAIPARPHPALNTTLPLAAVLRARGENPRDIDDIPPPKVFEPPSERPTYFDFAEQYKDEGPKFDHRKFRLENLGEGIVDQARKESFCDLIFRVGFRLTITADLRSTPPQWAKQWREKCLERYFPAAPKGERYITGDQELPKDRGESGYKLLTNGLDGYEKAATVLRERWGVDPYERRPICMSAVKRAMAKFNLKNPQRNRHHAAAKKAGLLD